MKRLLIVISTGEASSPGWEPAQQGVAQPIKPRKGRKPKRRELVFWLSTKELGVIQSQTIRSSFTVDGVRLFCDSESDSFIVQSRHQIFHRTEDIDEALVVFEGLCLEDGPTRTHARRLIAESRRNKRHTMTSLAAWERTVIEHARRRSEGLRPVICGSKGSVTKWVSR